MSSYIYDDAFEVWETLSTIDQSPELQRAFTLRFELSEEPSPSLTEKNRSLLFELNADKLIKLESVQEQINHYRSLEQHKLDWAQQLAALNARLRTLELRTRNIDQELAKGGFFRGKRQQELQRESERLVDKLLQVRNEVSLLNSQLDQVEQARRLLGKQVSTQEDLREAKWVIDHSAVSGGVVISLSNEGKFLLKYLSEMKPDAIKGRTLPQVLVYGIAWSMG